MRKRWLLIGVLVAIVGVSFSCKAAEEMVLRDVAKRLGVEPSLSAVGTHIGTNLLKVGMPYEEVHRNLEEIGPYKLAELTGPPPELNCERVIFHFGWGVYLDMILCYDEDMELNYLEHLDIP